MLCYREVVCCGTIYKGPNGEVLIDPRFLKPCKARLAAYKPTSEAGRDEKSLSSDTSNKSDSSDSSSDSGYDESSNPGAEKESASTYKKEEVFLEKCDISISPIAVGN